MTNYDPIDEALNVKSEIIPTPEHVVSKKKNELKVFGEKVTKLIEKNVPTNPSKWAYYKAQAKKKFDVYPSAYANGWAARKYKAAGGGWKKG